jgi:magnesium chelatase family protein
LKITINLAPADLKKQGPSYDLPIALSVLLASGKIAVQGNLQEMAFIGELALSGQVRPVNGVLSVAMLARKKGIRKLFVPEDNASEAKLVKNLEVYPVKCLVDAVKHLAGIEKIIEQPEMPFNFANSPILFDMGHVRGQEHVKRALEISAAGSHNILMSGSPGSGKTLLAKTMPSILPNLTMEEALELTKIYSVSGNLPANTSLLKSRPFRSPHHTASGAALVGGGVWPKPGEISLAHRGVLFLDEFGEFPRHILENLRQPLEDGVINVSRAAGNLSFPAKFILVAAMNPCPCGYLGDKEKACICSNSQIVGYRKKISGPILDRIDLHVDVPRVDFDKLSSDGKTEESAVIKNRVEAARLRQRERFKHKKIITNSEMSSQDVKEICNITAASKDVLRNAVNHLHMSARSYFRVLKLARTIADLDNSTDINFQHVAEALNYRPNDSLN